MNVSVVMCLCYAKVNFNEVLRITKGFQSLQKWTSAFESFLNRPWSLAIYQSYLSYITFNCWRVPVWWNDAGCVHDDKTATTILTNFLTAYLNSQLSLFSFFRYMKYLYPYECEKLKLSNPSELQAAIDGNRREGRRPSYGGYEFTPIPTMIPTTPPHLNGAAILNGRPPAGSSPAGLWAYAWCCLHSFAFYNYVDFNNDRFSFKIYHDFFLIQNLITLE